MLDTLHIYVDRLKQAHIEKIEQTLPPSCLEIEEADLQFPEEIQISGEAYLANEHLVVHLFAQTTVCLPCSICNHLVRTPVIVRNHYHSEPLKEISNGIFDVTKEVREALLLQIPQFTECNGKNCPQRNSIKKFLKQPTPLKTDSPSSTTYLPFADL